MFAKNYMALFSSFKTDPSVIVSFLGEILNDIQNEGTTEAPITVDDVTRLFHKLEHKKADGLSGAELDHFIYLCKPTVQNARCCYVEINVCSRSHADYFTQFCFIQHSETLEGCFM